MDSKSARIALIIGTSEFEMPLRAPTSKRSVNKAGEILISRTASLADREEAQNLVNAWRASFTIPLRAVFKQMSTAARKVDARAINSRRLKRMESIVIKLARPEMQNMKLSTMQDIGGCRAIFPTLRSLNAFRRKYEDEIRRRESYVNSSDYISPPKPDGYRGLHLIVRPEFKSQKYRIYNSQRIEIQFRTMLQHAWATTVETVDMFHGQKMKIGSGDPKWRRFFALCSTAFAMEENAHIVPGTIDDPQNLAAEISELCYELDPFRKMDGWKTALNAIDRVRFQETQKIAVITVDVGMMRVIVDTFSNDKVELANSRYADLENEIRNGWNAHTVLVAVDRMRDLKEAYPNLYADTQRFNDHTMAFLRTQGF